MRRPSLPALALVSAFALLGACASPRPAPPGVPGEAGDPGREAGRTAVLLAVNDVYRIEGAEEGKAGGIARLRTLREELEREAPDLLVFHAGDMLSPSFLSRTYKGEQMIDVLNLLDGSPEGFDDRMFATFGNHEFDEDDPEDAADLDRRVEDSQFHWLNGNVVFKNGDDGKPLIEAPRLAPTALVESGGIRFGIFGLTIDTKHPAYVESFRDPVEVARQLSAELRSRGAEVVVGLTHLKVEKDRALLEALGDAGPDLILGGHDHGKMEVAVAGRKIFKADADARTATVVRLTVRGTGEGRRIEAQGEHRPLAGDSPAPDPEVQARVESWLDRHEKLFCEKAGDGPGCLEEVLGRTQTLLGAEETRIRAQETSLGNWLADLMVKAFDGCGAQAAFINSGTLRLNQDLAAGTELTRRHLEELFGFPTPLRLLRIDGKTLQQVLDNSVQEAGEGPWLQVSGLAFVHDGKKARNLTLLTPGGGRPIQPDETILVVTNDYLINPKGDQDGYKMLSPSQRIACGGELDLKKLTEDALRAAGSQGIAPRVEGRVCTVPAAPGCDAIPAGGR